MKIILLIVSCLIILLSLLQGGKTEGFKISGSNLFTNVKERGTEKTLSRVMICLIVSFFILVVLI